MVRCLPAVILFAWFLLGQACLAETTLYVAVDGGDANPGTQAQPLGSIERARDLVRERKAAGNTSGPIRVHVGPGTYFLGQPLRFTAADSGSPDAEVVYEGAAVGKTILSGGMPIRGWQKGPGHLWQTRVDAVARGDLYFKQLFVDSRRAQRAVSPNRFYHRSAGPDMPLTDRNAARRDPRTKVSFRFHEGDIEPWANLDDVLVTVYHSWTASLHGIREIDPVRRIVRFTNPAGWPMGYWEPRQRYQVENYFEALDSPGEWYLDRATGLLSYWPREGEDMTEVDTVAAVLESLVELNGTPEDPITHLTLRGLSLRHADWRFDREETIDGQAHASAATCAVLARFAVGCTVEACEIGHVGSHALWLEKGCQDNRIVQCHLHDLGGGGVYVGEKDKRAYMPPDDASKVRRNLVENCFIHDFAHRLHGSIGIWVGSSSENVLRRNEISDFNYTGISVGWCWGREKDIYQHGNVIEGNHVHHTAGEMLSDNGGIYVLGWSPESVIRNNWVHDIFHYPYINKSRGIYLDGNTSGYLVEKNLCHDIGSYGVTVKGEYNTVRDNIFAFCGDSGFDRVFKAHATQFDYAPDTIRRNIVCQRIANMTTGYYDKRWTEIDENLYWSTEFGAEIAFSDRSSRLLDSAEPMEAASFAAWQALGRDRHSVVADPRFLDLGERDFCLADDSPARKIGIQPIDMTSVGLFGDAAWVDLPKKYPPRKLQFAPPPPIEKVDYDFEALEPGLPPVMRGQIAAQNGAKIVVTDEVAASGRQSLKFLDSAQATSYQPHLWIGLHPVPGPLVLRCDVRLDPDRPATARLELRDYTPPQWVSGPTLTFRPNGRIDAGRREVATIPPGTWIHVEIALEQGKTAGVPYTLRIGPRGGKPTTLDNLPPVREQFKTCTWFGISTLDREETAFTIDNLNIDVDETSASGR